MTVSVSTCCLPFSVKDWIFPPKPSRVSVVNISLPSFTLCTLQFYLCCLIRWDRSIVLLLSLELRYQRRSMCILLTYFTSLLPPVHVMISFVLLLHCNMNVSNQESTVAWFLCHFVSLLFTYVAPLPAQYEYTPTSFVTATSLKYPLRSRASDWHLMTIHSRCSHFSTLLFLLRQLYVRFYLFVAASIGYSLRLPLSDWSLSQLLMAMSSFITLDAHDLTRSQSRTADEFLNSNTQHVLPFFFPFLFYEKTVNS